MNLEAIILAGGLGTRLKECVPDLPKPLAHIQDRPFLDVLLQQLSDFDVFSCVHLAIGYKADEIKRYYQNANYPFQLNFVTEDMPLGTGGAIQQALSFTTSENVLILNGDSYVDFDLQKLIQIHTLNNSDCTIGLIPVEDAGRFGRVDFDTKTMKIKAFCEKDPMAGAGCINAGVYLVRRNFLNDYELKPPFSIEKQVFSKVISKQKLYGYESEGRFIDIGTPESYKKAQTYLQGLVERMS